MSLLDTLTLAWEQLFFLVLLYLCSEGLSLHVISKCFHVLPLVRLSSEDLNAVKSVFKETFFIVAGQEELWWDAFRYFYEGRTYR